MPTLYQALNSWGVHGWPADVLAVVVPCLIVVVVVLTIVGFSTYVERKVAADIQRRIGPNQCNVGPFFGEFARVAVRNGASPNAGFSGRAMAAVCKALLPLLNAADRILSRLAPGVLIFMADGLKLILKEDIIPDATDKPLFRAAPYVVLASAVGALAVLPYSDAWYVADFNIGVFYIAAITSLEVLGILMAGWASNNKWALLGGMRSAAQIVSYEVPVGLALATGILICGTMSMQGMTYDQLGLRPGSTWYSDGWLWQWNIFHPAMFVLAPVYFLAALAECNRTPFDIPEAESELVSGYHIEYSGMRFAIFFMAEYTMMCVTSAIAVTLFLGGWSTGIGLILLMMWIRWTLPRFRVDQMMTLCWKKLIPVGVACFLAVCVWLIVRMVCANRIGEVALERTTFWLRACFAGVVLGWLVWYFRRPLTPAEQAQRELIARPSVPSGAPL
ncbi:MAG: NADH-quinone oxidoreductase subunit H [Planctomycetota bacterium]|nr:NADH-quinone oxidoreductase subunit H [Planctomycetota bacterium]